MDPSKKGTSRSAVSSVRTGEGESDDLMSWSDQISPRSFVTVKICSNWWYNVEGQWSQAGRWL